MAASRGRPLNLKAPDTRLSRHGDRQAVTSTPELFSQCAVCADSALFSPRPRQPTPPSLVRA